MKKKIVLISIYVLTLALLVAAGSTLAWLIDTSGPVDNVFQPSNIDVELTESTGETYKMIPGTTLKKDPTVTVENDIDCYVFLEVTKLNNPDSYLTYSIADGWNPLTDANKDGIADDGVYYREVAATADIKTFAVLTGNVVTVDSSVTKTMMDALYADGQPIKNLPQLTFNAYAIQKTSGTAADGSATYFTPEQAWAEIN